MFIVKKYHWCYTDCVFCRTIEGAKKAFIQILEDWKKEYSKGYSPQDFSDTATTWEEFWEELWEDRMWDDVVSCEPIQWEEDKNGA